MTRETMGDEDRAETRRVVEDATTTTSGRRIREEAFERAPQDQPPPSRVPISATAKTSNATATAAP